MTQSQTSKKISTVSLAPGETMIEITMQGGPSTFTSEQKSNLLMMLALSLGCPLDMLNVLTIRMGRLKIKMPAKVTSWLITLYETGNLQISGIEIEQIRIISEQVSGGPIEGEALMAQAAKLLDSGLAIDQRKALAERMGRVYGNKTLQKILKDLHQKDLLQDRHGSVVIDLVGDITIHAKEAINKTYQSISSGGAANIIFNFDGTNYINTAGMAILIGIVTEARKRNQKLLMTGLSAHFQKLFGMVGLTQYAHIYPTVEDVLTSLNIESAAVQSYVIST